MDLDFILRANPDYVEELYSQYLRDAQSVGADWAHFFAGFEYGADGRGAAAQAERHLGVLDLIHSYRELGHLIADLNPLGGNPTEHPLLARSEFGFDESDLDRVVECPTFRGHSHASLRELIALLRATYCGTLGVEYMYISDKAQRDWLKERMEPSLNKPELSSDDRLYIFSKRIGIVKVIFLGLHFGQNNAFADIAISFHTDLGNT